MRSPRDTPSRRRAGRSGSRRTEGVDFALHVAGFVIAASAAAFGGYMTGRADQRPRLVELGGQTDISRYRDWRLAPRTEPGTESDVRADPITTASLPAGPVAGPGKAPSTPDTDLQLLGVFGGTALVRTGKDQLVGLVVGSSLPGQGTVTAISRDQDRWTVHFGDTKITTPAR